MANQSISQLPVITGPLTGNELSVVVQNGVTKQAQLQAIANLGGPTGPQGPIGPQGPRGYAATIQVYSTTTGLPGTNASVTNAGSINDAYLEFVIPRGDQGIQGATGATGATGPTGPQGPQGIPGVGIPAGGTTGQILYKVSNTDYDVNWENVPAIGVTSFQTSLSGLTPSTSTTGAVTLAGTLGVTSGGTGAVTLTGYLKGNGTSAITGSATIPTTDLSGTISNAQLANSAITINGTPTSLGGSINVGTVTSVSGTAPVVSSGGATPTISMAAASSSTNGYLTSTDWNTFNSKQPAGTYVTNITSSTLSIGGTGAVPTINLTSGIVTPGTTGSSSLIPVVTVDTYGRVTSVTTAANPQGTVTSVSGTGSVNGITLTGTVTSAGSLTLGGTLGNIGNSQLSNSAITINGNSVSLGGSITVTAASSSALTIGTGLSGTSYNGSSPVTIALANTTVVSGSYGSPSQTPQITVNAQGQITSIVNDTISIPASAINTTIPNSGLTNSAITVGGTSISLGGSGSFPLTNLTDVNVSGPVLGQLLGWNGSNWVNVSNNPSGSAGQGISFWNATPLITGTGTNNTLPIITLATTPVTAGGTQTATSNPNNNTVAAIGLQSAPLGRTVLDAGQWTFDIYASVNSTAGGSVTTFTRNTYQIIFSSASSITLTTTGTGTSRTVTASSSFFSTAVASATNTVADYLETPQGLYQITAKTSNTVVTIAVPSTYANETAVNGSLWHNLFGVTSPAITNITPNYGLYIVQTTQPAFTINATDALGGIGFTTSNANRTVTATYNGTDYASNVLTPLVTLHNGLGGLQGGSSSQYYHLSSAEYTGTGSGVFARASSPTLTSPNLGTPTSVTLTNATGLPLTTGVTGILPVGNGGTGASTLTGYVKGSGTSALTASSTIPTTDLNGTISNAQLANSTITLGSSTLTLGGTTTTVAGLTLTSPTIATISNTGTLTLPTSTDTLVGRATTDTLTNKSISGSTNTFSNIPNTAITGLGTMSTQNANNVNITGGTVSVSTVTATTGIFGGTF